MLQQFCQYLNGQFALHTRRSFNSVSFFIYFFFAKAKRQTNNALVVKCVRNVSVEKWKKWPRVQSRFC